MEPPVPPDIRCTHPNTPPAQRHHPSMQAAPDHLQQLHHVPCHTHNEADDAGGVVGGLGVWLQHVLGGLWGREGEREAFS